MTLGRSRTVSDGGLDRAVAARERLLSAHAETIADVIGVADEIAAGWDAPPRDSAAVTEPLATALEAKNLETPLLDALADAVAAVGERLPHEPVPQPPYLAVTGRGPVLRATPDAGRLVAVVGVFRVERGTDDDGETADDGRGPRYVRAGDTPEAVLTVEFHGEETTVAGPGDETAGDGADDTDGDDAGGQM